MTRLTLFAVSAFAAVAIAGTAAAAPSRSELEARLQIAEQRARDLDARLEAIENDRLTGDPIAVTMQQRVDALERELTRVTGLLEEATFDNQNLRNELRATRRLIELRDEEIAAKVGLDEFTFGIADEPEPDPFARARAAGAADDEGLDGEIEDGLTPTDPDFYRDDPFAAAKARAQGSLGDTVAVVLPDDPDEALDYAKQLMLDAQYEQAAEAFGRFTATFPNSSKVGEALYWRGETYFLREGYNEAKDLYIESIQRDPRGPRAADSMVKLAASLARMGFSDEACSTLAAFPQQYPNADLAVKAKAAREEQQAGCG